MKAEWAESDRQLNFDDLCRAQTPIAAIADSCRTRHLVVASGLVERLEGLLGATLTARSRGLCQSEVALQPRHDIVRAQSFCSSR